MSARISEILWKAANEHLNVAGARQDGEHWGFCCQAIVAAMGLRWWDGTVSRHDYPEMAAIVFLQELGMPLHMAFANDRNSSQQIRYTWLMFASMVAAEMEKAGEI